jgi:PAS domain S-box-containing protein
MKLEPSWVLASAASPVEAAASTLAQAAAPLDESALEQLPVGHFRKDAAGRFVFVNACFCQFMATAADQILGLTAEQIAARELHTPANRWLPELATQASLHHQRIMRDGQPREREEADGRPAGRPQHFHVVESAVWGPGGVIVGSQGVVFDVTHIKQADALVANERDLLRALLDNSPDHIYFKDTESRFIRVSTSQAVQFGMKTADGLVGKTDFDIFSDAHARPAYEDEQNIIRTGVPMVGKVERETWMDGRPDTWALTTKMPLRNRDGEIIGTFGITKDISELKFAERRFEEVHRQLLEASRLAGMAEIATNVLHNVGNVLNSINVSADLISTRLRSSKLPGLDRALRLMAEHADDLGGFITQDPKGKLLPGYLQQLAPVLQAEQAAIADELELLGKRVEHIKEVVAAQQSYAGAPRMVEAMQLAALVEDALRINAGALTRHQITVVKQLPELPDLPLDRHRLLQILVNLIGNAKQALDGVTDREHQIKLGASLAETANGRVLRITVADNGEGIAPKNLSRLFAHGFTTRKGGHGFGLHSCVLAVQEMGGSLVAHSDGPNCGALFTIELPIDTVPSPA